MNLYIMKRCLSKSSVAVFAVLLLFFLFAANVFWGSVDIPANSVLSAISGGGSGYGPWDIIIFESRLPQALTALLAGASISVAGLLLQTLFRNPLAGPEVLGVNGGAGLGVAVVMLLFQGAFLVDGINFGGHVAVLAGAFIGASLIMAIILLFSMLLRNNMFLLITGVAVSYIVSSVVSLLNYSATSEGVHSFMVWGMGSFGAVTLEQIPVFAPLLLVLLCSSLLLMKKLDAMLLGDMYARNLGINVKSVRLSALAITGMLTAVVTAYCGPVSFLGLAVPHIARLSFGSNSHKWLLPAVILLGGAVALLCNLICQLPGESGVLPLGAVTPLIGAPVIIYVVLRNRNAG